MKNENRDWMARSRGTCRRMPPTPCAAASVMGSRLTISVLATVLGRVPPDYHAWIVTDEVSAFVRFEGPRFATRPVWRIELTSPRWPE